MRGFMPAFALASAGAILVYLGLLAAVLWVRFRSGAWRRLELVERAV